MYKLPIEKSKGPWKKGRIAGVPESEAKKIQRFFNGGATSEDIKKRYKFNKKIEAKNKRIEEAQKDQTQHKFYNTSSLKQYANSINRGYKKFSKEGKL